MHKPLSMVTRKLEYHSTVDVAACNKYKCRGCAYSTNRSSNLRRHEKAMHKPLSMVSRKIEYHSTVDVAGLENEIVRGANEYQRKLELGKQVKQIVQELNVPITSLDREKMEALEQYENYE